MTPLGWAAPRLPDHATLAAGLRAACGGLPGRGAADALRDPLPEAGPQQGRRGGHPRASGGAQEPGHPAGPGRRGGGSLCVREGCGDSGRGRRKAELRVPARDWVPKLGSGARGQLLPEPMRVSLKAYRYFSE